MFDIFTIDFRGVEDGWGSIGGAIEEDWRTGGGSEQGWRRI